MNKKGRSMIRLALISMRGLLLEEVDLADLRVVSETLLRIFLVVVVAAVAE